MEAHQQRVVDEKTELDVKLKKLSDFLETDKFKSLDEKERYLLKRQHEYMSNYSDILEERIELWKK